MPSVPTRGSAVPPRRLDLERSNAAPVHHLDTPNVLDTPVTRRLNAQVLAYIRAFAPARRMRECGRPFGCNLDLCPRCTGRSAATSRLAWIERTEAQGEALVLTLTIEGDPSLAEAWERLARVRRQWLSAMNLSSRTAGWRRETEIVHRRGWHVHEHVLILGADAAFLVIMTVGQWAAHGAAKAAEGEAPVQ